MSGHGGLKCLCILQGGDQQPLTGPTVPKVGVRGAEGCSCACGRSWTTGIVTVVMATAMVGSRGRCLCY